MDELKIYIDRLRDEGVETVDESVDAQAFDIREAELQLEEKVTFSGSAYCTKEHLLLDLHIQTKAVIPCVICNQFFSYPIDIDKLTLTVPIEEISDAIYDMTEEIRSAILLKIPPFYECHKEKCPTRKELNQYFKQEGNLSFSDLTL